MRSNYLDKERDLAEKTKLYKLEEKDLKHLDASIEKTKHPMEQYLETYEKLTLPQTQWTDEWTRATEYLQ